jgi:hypothetical protein
MSQPNSAEIIARLSEAERGIVAERMVRIERLLARRHEQETELVAALLRILESSNPQAKRFQELVKEIANG